MEHESDGDAFVIGPLGTISKEWINRPEDLEIRGQVENHPDYNIIENGQILRRNLKT